MKIKPIRWVHTARGLVNPADLALNYSGTVEGCPEIEFRVYPRRISGAGFENYPVGGSVKGIDGFFDFSYIQEPGIEQGGSGYVVGMSVEIMQGFFQRHFQKWVMNFFGPEPISGSEVSVSRYDIIKESK